MAIQNSHSFHLELKLCRKLAYKPHGHHYSYDIGKQVNHALIGCMLSLKSEMILTVQGKIRAKARHYKGTSLRNSNSNDYGLTGNGLNKALPILWHSLLTYTCFLYSCLVITGHLVSANPHFHKEEVGSSWSVEVALGADLPSGDKFHLSQLHVLYRQDGSRSHC